MQISMETPLRLIKDITKDDTGKALFTPEQIDILVDKGQIKKVGPLLTPSDEYVQALATLLGLDVPTMKDKLACLKRQVDEENVAVLDQAAAAGEAFAHELVTGKRNLGHVRGEGKK